MGNRRVFLLYVTNIYTIYMPRSGSAGSLDADPTPEPKLNFLIEINPQLTELVVRSRAKPFGLDRVGPAGWEGFCSPLNKPTTLPLWTRITSKFPDICTLAWTLAGFKLLQLTELISASMQILPCRQTNNPTYPKKKKHHPVDQKS